MTYYLFISKQYQKSAKLAFITFVLAFIVILFGAYTRLTNAGLSCPDWPHCYGYITAPHTKAQLLDAAQKFPFSPVDIKKAWTEMTHRYLAGLEGILIFILSFSLLRRSGRRDTLSRIAVALIVLLSVQVLLGMFTVTAKLKPIIVLLHLLTGLSILSMLWLAYLNMHPFKFTFPMKPVNSTLFVWFWLAAIILSVQIALGGWTSTNYAGLACVDFPYCDGELFPTLKLSELDSNLITIHMLHRIGALVTATYLSFFALFLLSKPLFKSIAWLLLLGIILQITLGILNILWLRPVWIALLHEASAIFLLLTTLTALTKAYFAATEDCYGS